MTPQTIQRLSESTDFKDVVAYLVEQLGKLNTIADLRNVPLEHRSAIVEARLEAHTTLSAILKPIIDPVDIVLGTNPEDYRV